MKILMMLVRSDRYLIGIFDDDEVMERAIKYHRNKHRGLKVEFDTLDVVMNQVIDSGEPF